MTAILKLNTDLLWFGGIGTYIRASAETDDQVGDRVNDPIRVTGAALRCKVVGEGANLGVTQKGRIEAAMRGVRLNTDAIDNSAGVNTSDVEVNIKIALTLPVRDGRLNTETRNNLLAEMTEEVGRLVLRNNYQQTLALSLGAAARAGRSRLPAAPDADAGEPRPARPRGRIPARRHGDRRAAQARAGADAAGARGAARLRQAHALQRSSRIERAGRSVSRPRAVALFPEPAGRAAIRTRSISTGCAARSSPRSSPTR